MKIKAYITALALMMFMAGCSTTPSAERSVASDENEMEYVTVCNRDNDCRKLSRLVLGTDHLIQADWTGNGSPQLTEEQVQEVLNEAVKLGINFFDTSPIYVNGVENALGRWMKSRKEQNSTSLYALSKGGFPFDLFYSKRLAPGKHSPALKAALREQGILAPHPKILEDGSTELTDVPPGTYASRLYGDRALITARVAEELGHSQNNLGQFLTVYLMHRDDGDFIKFDPVPRKQTSVKDIMEALNSPEIASQYWMLGWSNWKTSRVNESIQLASKNSGLPLPGFNSPYFSLFEMSKRTIHAGGVQVTHAEMSNADFQKGIRMLTYSPLGGFSILDKPQPLWANARLAAKEKYDNGDPYWMNVYPSVFTSENEARWKRVEAFTETFNREHGTKYTVDQMMNAYVLAHKRADFLAIGAITVDQLRRSVGALKLARKLTQKDLDYLYSGKR